MNKFQEAIREYEEKRQVVVMLEKERNYLLSRCMKIDHADFHSKICLVNCYNDTRQACNENNEYFSFSEILEEGHCSDDYCDNCVKAYHLRKGDLSQARQKFGDAKRRLSFLGKVLLKK